MHAKVLKSCSVQVAEGGIAADQFVSAYLIAAGVPGKAVFLLLLFRLHRTHAPENFTTDEVYYRRAVVQIVVPTVAIILSLSEYSSLNARGRLRGPQSGSDGRGRVKAGASGLIALHGNTVDDGMHSRPCVVLPWPRQGGSLESNSEPSASLGLF